MKRKRCQNEGTIRQRKDGIWEARYSLGRNSEGKQYQKSVYGKTEDEVKGKLKKALALITVGEYLDESDMSLYDWIKDWLFVSKKHTVKPATFQINETLIRNHIKNSSIGNTPLKKLKSFHIKEFYNSKVECLAPATIKRMHVVIKESLDEAILNKMLRDNPARGIKLPKIKQKQIDILTVDEQIKFLAAARQENWRTIFVLALQTGLRLGELIGLKWKDIDLKLGELSVCRTYKRIRVNFDDNNKAKTNLVISEPKSDKGRRTIPLMSTAIEELERHKTNQNVKSLEDWVFVGATGKKIEPRRVTHVMNRIIKKAKIKHINFHALRHTFASRLIESAVDAKTVSEILGHADVAFTLKTYAHILPENKQNAVEKVNNLFV